MLSKIWDRPVRFLTAAALLAALLCLFPVKVDAPMEPENETLLAAEETAQPPQRIDQPVGADLSERTAAGCFLHRTLHYAPCGHSTQRREKLPARLVGLSREALEREMEGVIPGAAVTGFSAHEVDIAQRLSMPCPLHWMLRGGEDNRLSIWQNRDGERMEQIRGTELMIGDAPEEEQEALREGRIFDDVQALEGYLESLSS